MIQLTEAQYLSLLESEARLEALECAGVDNWTNYGCNCDITDEDECIFCTEKDLKEFFNV